MSEGRNEAYKYCRNRDCYYYDEGTRTCGYCVVTGKPRRDICTIKDCTVMKKAKGRRRNREHYLFCFGNWGYDNGRIEK